MRLVNYTNFQDAKVREIIQFVKPHNLPTSNFDVKVTNSDQKYCGKFYRNGGFSKKGVGSDRNRPLIIVRVSKNENNFPLTEDHRPTRVVKLYYDHYNERKGVWEGWWSSKQIGIRKGSTGGYIDSLFLSREEALVHIMAHELRHLWQKDHPERRGRVWGARGQYSDRDADAYAIQKSRLWRKLHAVDIYREQPDLTIRSDESMLLLKSAPIPISK